MAFWKNKSAPPVRRGFINFESVVKPTPDEIIENLVIALAPSCFGQMLASLEDVWADADGRDLSGYGFNDTFRIPFDLDGAPNYISIPIPELYGFLSKLYQRLEEINVGEVRHIDDIYKSGEKLNG